MNTPLSFSDADLPSLFRYPDQESLKAQKMYLGLTKMSLWLLVIGSVSSSIFVTADITATIPFLTSVTLNAVSALALFGSTIITTILSLSGFEKNWYAGRAIAESVKTLSWRYMMGAEPYEMNISSTVVEKRFETDVLDVLGERRYLDTSIRAASLGQTFITPTMQQVRGMSVVDRDAFYQIHRVREQKAWYSRKAKQNEKIERVSYMITVVTQLAALVSAIVLIIRPDSPINPTGIFTSIAGAFMAWTQLKQSHVLSQAYAFTAHELALIAEKGGNIKTNKELSDFVLDAENAVSREHTMWRAKRE